MDGELGRVLITGGGRGIGRAIALELARCGWTTAIHYANDKASARATIADLGNAASGIYQADLEDPSSAKKLFEEVEVDGPLTALVNNAGVYVPVNFLEASDEEFQANFAKTMRTNFVSPLRLCRLAAKAFASRGGGKILNVASRVGFKGESGACVYAASKAALINLTRSLAVELAHSSIGVFGIAPGWVETAMAREGMHTRLDQILSDIPVKRMASPEDCANAAAFLLSPSSAYLSGEVIDINGASYFH